MLPLTPSDKIAFILENSVYEIDDLAHVLEVPELILNQYANEIVIKIPELYERLPSVPGTLRQKPVKKIIAAGRIEMDNNDARKAQRYTRISNTHRQCFT